MKAPAIDEHAKKIVNTKFALPPCLHVPVAARDEDSIELYIGKIRKVLSPGNPNNAVLVERYDPPPSNRKLPIWQLESSTVIHAPRQVWVHVDYTGYRRAYAEAFPERDLTGLVLDHVLNREVARLKGFQYLRIIPISRAANSSSGGMSERWSREFHSTPRMRRKHEENPVSIQYADLADIVKMLDIKTGGKLQLPVNEAQALVEEP